MYSRAVRLFVKLAVWLLVVILVSLAALFWRPLAGEGAWIRQIAQGQLILVAVSVTSSAVGYAAMARVNGTAENLRILIIALGLVVLVISLLLYGGYSNLPNLAGSAATESPAAPHNLALNSYLVFLASLIIGGVSIYVTDRSEQEANE
jgi:hypothetical protein